MKVSLPRCGSAAILNASAENGSLSSGLRRTTFSASLTSWPSMSGTSSGLGRKALIASSRGWTPLFLNAVPVSTGVSLLAMVARRMAATICSWVGSSPSRYISMISSSASASVSISLSRHSAAISVWLAGISSTV